MKLRTLDRYTFFSVLKIGVVTSLLASLMLLGVDLFSNIYTYLNNEVGLLKGFMVTCLSFPESFLLAMGPSFMFAVTYHLSMLHANNEIMCLLNSGVNFRRIIRPCLVLAVLLSVFHFAVNETVAIDLATTKAARMQDLSGLGSDLRNNRNVALSDMQEGYMVFASTYTDSNSTLYDVTLVEVDENSRLVRRTDAQKAVFNNGTGLWDFYGCSVFEPENEGDPVVGLQQDHLVSSVMQLEPELFRSGNSGVDTMPLKLAISYTQRMKQLNPEEYAHVGTEFYKRVFSCLTPLVMMLIACSMNYGFKKNVLFFSIISSLCFAVVYYVLQMMTIMLADQAVIAPQLGILLPFAIVLVLDMILGFFTRRR